MLLLVSSALAATLSVGPSGDFAAPCAAIATAQAGDRIEIDAAGDYAGDTCAWSTDGLTLVGVNGRPTLDGTGADLSQGKGIWVIQAPTATVENVAFTGASVPDGNGAGIRHQGTDLTVTGCDFRDNENGILGAPPVNDTGVVTVVESTFVNNGAGDGYTHNVYLNHYERVVFQRNTSQSANSGHLLKSRALETWVTYNRFIDVEGATTSYELDLPSGGRGVVVGNVFVQAATSENGAVVSFGAESLNPNPAVLLFAYNTVVTERDNARFIAVGADVTVPVLIVNNVFVGDGVVTEQASATVLNNHTGEPGLDAEGVPPDDSPLLDAAVDATHYDPDLVPTLHVDGTPRVQVGDAFDIGAWEVGEPVYDSGPRVDSAEPPCCKPLVEGCGCSNVRPGAGWLALLGLVVLWGREPRSRARREPRSRS
jgi:hypothetical protein